MLKKLLPLVSRAFGSTGKLLIRAAKQMHTYEFFENINTTKLPAKSKRALIIYDTYALPYFLNDKLESFPYLQSHTMYWESCELARLLNQYGYIVDYLHYASDRSIAWEKYSLVIDSMNHLPNHTVKGQQRVYYTTHCHWLFNNQAELRRLNQFRTRHHLNLPPTRQLTFGNADEQADYLTYFGTDFLLNSGYSHDLKSFPLSISSCYSPTTFSDVSSKDLSQFLWLGGAGGVHKGLDLAVEAIEKIPQAKLHVVGGFESEPQFDHWLKARSRNEPRIILHGRLQTDSAVFEQIAQNCIGIVYPSCAEGGPGSVAQALHFGLIPIVTNSSNVRAEDLGFVISEHDDVPIIDSLMGHIETVMSMQVSQANKHKRTIRAYAQSHHTRQAYSQSIIQLIEEFQ